MNIKRSVIISFFVIALIAGAGFPAKSQYTLENGVPVPVPALVAGRNVNMVSDDPNLQRQNEPSLDVSSINPRHLLAGANDYSLVDFVGDEVDVTYDSWLGVFKSYNGGESWEHDLLPPYQGIFKGGATDTNHPLYGFDAAADPTVRAGKNGWFFFSGIAFDRERNGKSVVFVLRYKDNGSSIDYVDTTIIDEGTSGQFQDKPWIITDKYGRVYIVYSIFLGEINVLGGSGGNSLSKIMIARSLNNGDTWEKPSKLSEGEFKNQGTTVTVDQNNGTIYVAWRRFARVNVTDAIVIAKSENFGRSFTKAEEVATIDFPFDQPTMGYLEGASQFRTLSFPTIAVDDNGRIYLAWSQRISELGGARIVITSLAGENWGVSWPTPVTIEPLSIDDPRPNGEQNMPCHQIMPTMIYRPAIDKLMIAWFDNRFSARRYDDEIQLRDDAPGPFPWIRDQGAGWRETIDVRMTQTNPGPTLNFDDSIQVSRYLWVLVPDGEDSYRLRQGQFNPPNYWMFSAGTKPFHGDYIDIAQSLNDPNTVYISWTDNRDVRPPDDEGFWWDYTPPQPLDPHTPCDPAESVAGMRNQNVYCSKITRGINIGTFQNNLAPGDTSFVIFIQNLLDPPDFTDPYASITFDVEILDSASFSPLNEEPLNKITVSVHHYSTIARQVFVNGQAGDTIRVKVSTSPEQNPPVEFEDYIYLNLVAGGAPGGTANLVLNGTTRIDWNDPELITTLNPSITNPSITNPSITNAGILNPSIINPSITNANIINPSITNPSITNPSITNPSITNPSITNPSITNPSITNANITNPSITNPSITNPSITNVPPASQIADKVWSVHNDGDAVAAYTFKGIAGETLPDDYVFSQLLIYKVHYTQSTNGCYLLTEAHHELIVNVNNPLVTTDTTGWTQADINKFIGDPEAWNSLIENATFSLAPGEHAVLMLRIMDLKPVGSKELSKVRTLSSSPLDYADEAGSVVVSHGSTENNPVGSASLMILPDALPSGIAGQDFPTTTLRAIGGSAESGYTWSIISGSLPEDMTLLGNILSGYVRRIGTFSFTVMAYDEDYDPNQTPPDRSHFDTHTFTIEILPPEPLTVNMMVPEPLNPYTTGDDYTSIPLATFTASGGVPPYFWTFTDNPVFPTMLPSGLSLLPTGTPGEMGLFGTLQAGEWNIIVKVTDDRLPSDPTAYDEDGFKLCVRPLQLEINLPDPAELEWSLGTEKTVQISVSNSVELPTWEKPDFPGGFNLGISGSPVDLTGLPEFDPFVDYPAVYPVTVTVTDPFTWCGLGPRTKESTPFNIIVNPKAPEWATEETNAGVATAIAADENGNTYVTGYIGIEGTRDYLTVKYNSQGNREWSITFDGPSGGDDMPKAIAADETGAYVTGFSEGMASGRDIYTVKYNPDGSMAWDSRYDGPSHLGDEANTITHDKTHVYVAGFVHRGNKSAHKDKVIIKLTKEDGEIVWDARYDSTRNGEDEVTAIAVDSSGNVYVTGKSQEGGNVPKSFDFLTLKFDSSGQMLWEVRDDGVNFGDDAPTAIALDSEGNFCVTGWQNVGANDTNFYTVKYDTDGQSVWSSGQEFGGSGEDKALAIAVDEMTGDVYVTGKVMGSDGLSDYATVKYSSDAGIQDLIGAYDSGNGEDTPVGLALSTENGEKFIYVAGFKTTESNGKDYFCIKYRASDKSIVWVGQYNSGAGEDDEATAMLKNKTGLYLTGFTTNGFLTVKYTQ